MMVPKSDRYIAPGTKVRLDSLLDENDSPQSEFGVLIHCWRDEVFSFYDCYVAFFGNEFPTAVPTEKPYVLRYASTSLTELDA